MVKQGVSEINHIELHSIPGITLTMENDEQSSQVKHAVRHVWPVSLNGE